MQRLVDHCKRMLWMLTTPKGRVDKCMEEKFIDVSHIWRNCIQLFPGHPFLLLLEIEYWTRWSLCFLPLLFGYALKARVFKGSPWKPRLISFAACSLSSVTQIEENITKDVAQCYSITIYKSRTWFPQSHEDYLITVYCHSTSSSNDRKY